MTRLSNRQFPMLALFIESSFLSIEDVQKFDQRPFRSMLIQQWVVYKPGRSGFAITPLGRKAWEEFQHTDIARKNPLAPLTRYFDATAYGLKVKAAS